MSRTLIILSMAAVTIVTGLAVAYFGIFKDSIRTVDNCSTTVRTYLVAPLVFSERFAYGDYRDPTYDASVPLMVCLCNNNDKTGYEKLINETTSDQIFSQVCKWPAPAPYYEQAL